MIITAEILMRGAAPGIMLDEFADIRRRSMHDLGVYWHAKMRPKHFRNAASRMYGYKPRKGERGNPDPHGFKSSYTGRKLRKEGHTRPLEYSGLSKALTKIKDVRTTSNKKNVTTTRVVIHSPGINRRTKHSEINMREELLTHTDQEVIKLTRLARKGLESRMKRITKTKRLK